VSDGPYDLLIVGGGPCGLAAAISAQRAGLKAVVLESAAIVSTIAQYPTYVTFFSTAEKLSLGDVPFIVATDKPTRRDGLAYYRAIVRHFHLPVRQYERVSSIERREGEFVVRSLSRAEGERETRAYAVVIATGYFGSPNRLGVPGETLPQVAHVYREGHEAFDQDAVVVGGGLVWFHWRSQEAQGKARVLLADPGQYQGRHGRDDHRRAPALPDAEGRAPAVPGDQRQRFGHEVEVRQSVRLPRIPGGCDQARYRCHGGGKGRGGRRLR